MKRDPSKNIARSRTNAESKTRKSAHEAASPADAEKTGQAAVPPSEADVKKEWDDEAWRPHRATCYWQADLADFGLDESQPDRPGPASGKTDK